MNKITWLHLSDLHISRDSKDKYRLDIIVDSLISDIMDQIRIHNLKLDFLFVSGDISFKGCKDELAYAETVFHKIAEAANISTDNIFFVPGNHDIARSSSANQEIAKFRANIGGTIQEDVISAPLQNYTSFANRFYNYPLYDENALFYETKRKVSGKTVSILGLNTAWAAVSDVKAGEVILGEYQVRKSLQKAENSDVIIALMHHPFSWLSEDDNYIAKRLLSKRTDFILTGHIHTVSDIGKLSIFGNSFCVTAGAIHDKSGKYSNSYNITVCDLESGTGNIYFRQFINAHGGFWSADNTIDQSIPDGVVAFQLPSRIQIENSEKQRFFKPTLPTQAAEKAQIETGPIPKIPRALIEDIRKRNCNLFAGAGASIDAGLPSWFELLSNGIEALDDRVSLSTEEYTELRNLLDANKFLVVADYLRYRLGERWFGEYLRKHLSTKGRRSVRQEILAEIPFKIVLTTNYDDFIEKYRDNAKVLLPKDLTSDGYDSVMRVLDDDATPIVKLHGSYDKADSIVFGDSEYSKLLYNSDNYRKAVERLLSENTCIFVGFGFSDINILAFLQSIREKKGKAAPKHYAIMKKVGPVMERYFRESLNVEPIYIEEYSQTDTILYHIKDSLT